MDLKEVIKFILSLKFIGSRKAEITDKIIGLVVGSIILFSLFGAIYTGYVASNPATTYCPPYYNATSPCPASHTLTYPILMTLLIISFLLIIWKTTRGSGK